MNLRNFDAAKLPNIQGMFHSYNNPKFQDLCDVKTLNVSAFYMDICSNVASIIQKLKISCVLKKTRYTQLRLSLSNRKITNAIVLPVFMGRNI